MVSGGEGKGREGKEGRRERGRGREGREFIRSYKCSLTEDHATVV